MSGKRNISYTKPQDPSFLAKLKQQIGYREGPTVETKRQKLEDFNSDNSDVEDRPERDEEKPQIVVLQSGDLTAEQVAQEEARIAREAAEAPADLTKPIVFQKRKITKEDKTGVTTSAISNTKSETSGSISKNNNNAINNKSNKQAAIKSKKAQQNQKSKLSFNDEDDDNAEEDI